MELPTARIRGSPLTQLLFLWFCCFAGAADSDFDVLQYINPLIGSTNGGNVFAGATRPYGLAKPVAVSLMFCPVLIIFHANIDGPTGQMLRASAQYTTRAREVIRVWAILPYSHNCARAMRSMPVSSESVTAPRPMSPAASPRSPGHFALELSNGIKAEMTSSEHAALYRFDFSADSNNSSHPLVLLDLSDLWQSRQNASVSVDATTGQMRGNGTFLPSFGAGSYVMHFCVDFFGADVFDNGVWVNNRAGTEPKDLYVTRGFNLFYIEAGGWVRFSNLADSTLTARMGISFISADQACRRAETEIPDPLNDFDRLVTETQDEWREQLSPITITPGNYTGENPKWDSGVPYFDSYYCLWDAFRVQHPLLTIVDPVAQGQMVNNLIDIYQNEGWLPDCHMSLCDGWTQGGSNADVVLVDAFVKNLTGIDWNHALEAIVQDAEVEPLEWSYHGRGGLQSWKNLDYIPYLDYDPIGFGTNSRSISRTLEYSYNDYCLAILADGLGKTDLYDKYIQRSTNWKNLWKEDQTSIIRGNDSGFTGFFQPKYMNGTWGYQDPIACSSLAGFCSLTTNPSETFEASIWQYQFLVSQQMSTLINLMGGDESFISRLDYFHTSGLADISNEPVFSTVYLYHYAGRPALSTKRLHTYIPSAFNNTNGGLPGNDDSGSMGAFVAFGLLGLFPIAGQNVYLISAPFFEEVSIKNGLTGNTATIKTVGFDPSYVDIYIQSVTVNGEVWTKNWIGHELFTQGWTLEITLGSKESDWGTKIEDRPPSLGDTS
ncbi:hypothetical protein G7054_g6768 [Neopestalotiopsis clavispora]|nr:hypothetical protein G7054_g6768 [Neopestalotiopsis clavispora]